MADHCLRSRNYANLIVIDKQPQLQWLDTCKQHIAEATAYAHQHLEDAPEIRDWVWSR